MPYLAGPGGQGQGEGGEEQLGSIKSAPLYLFCIESELLSHPLQCCFAEQQEETKTEEPAAATAEE